MDHRKTAAVLAALTLMTGAFSCGRDASSSSSQIAGADDTAVKIVGSESEDGETSSSSGSEDEETSSKEKSEGSGGEKATDASSDDKPAATTASGDGSSSGNGGSGNNGGGSSGEQGGGSSNGGGGSSANNGGSGDNGGGSSNGGGDASGNNGGENSGGGNEAPPEEEKVYTAEVALGSSPSVKGENVTVKGSTVVVTAGGDYRFSGKVSDGQICVSTATEEAVTIVLDGVDISNSEGPAIFVYEAKKCTIKVREGTVNTLSDGGNDKVNDGVIFSNDTLRFKGNGELNITSKKVHGIASDDDIIFENGVYRINAAKSGLIAHDDITVNGGSLDIKGGTNGIKSKGTIHINGGTTYVSGGTKEEKSSVYSAGQFICNDGALFAAGNKVTVPHHSEHPFVALDLGEAKDAGSTVALFINGKKLAEITPHNSFRCVMALSPDIKSGSSFYASVGGKNSETETISDGKNEFKF